jgi:RHS repeat-associated protein
LETPVWTTNGYDALGRVISVKTPDNAMMRTIYSGNTVTAIDQAGHDRQSKTDALGRVTEITEDPGTNGLNQITSYTYDAMDHLLNVSQGVQTRTYAYDSLSRLISSTNPENGTITFEYDDNSNLLKRTDERKISPTSQINVAVSYTYDEVNRVKTRSYNDGTPAVAYFYDDDALPSGAPTFTRGYATGRLVAVTYGGGSAGSYYGYDRLGRVTQSVQRTDGTNYVMSYQYNLAGSLIAESYPSGRVVRTTLDSVGRLSQVTGEINGVTKTYASSFGYSSQGALAKLKLGNGLWEHTTYDPKRLQVTEIGLGISASDSSQLKLTYNYKATPTATTNNGNVLSQTISAPGINLTQNFTYDELNRLSTSYEKQGTSVVWRQNYTYDRYGNRRLDEAGTTAALVGSNPQISTATNRIIGDGYDAVGNLTTEPGHAYQYDAESRLVSFGAVTTSTYSYDGAGQRVKKVVGTGSLAVTTTFVYDAGGKLIAEYGTNTAGSATGTSYVTMDRLSSTRLLTVGVIAKGGQAAKARYDYLPFGEEINASYGNRSQSAGYTPNEAIRQKYTGYERDIETGLDFAQARYYCNTQGRFISADSVAGTATSPQTLNRYAYTGNNPLNNVDPSGHMFYDASYNGSEGSGFSYPDNNGSLSNGVQQEYARVKGIIEQHKHEREEQQSNAPKPPPPLTQQQMDEGRASAEQAAGGPIPLPLTSDAVDYLLDGVQSFLSNGDCATFLDTLVAALPQKHWLTERFEGSYLDAFERVKTNGGFWSGNTGRYNAISDGNTISIIYRHGSVPAGLVSAHFQLISDSVHELTHLFTKDPRIGGVYGHDEMALAAKSAADKLGFYNDKSALLPPFPRMGPGADVAMSNYFGRILDYACRKVKF